MKRRPGAHKFERCDITQDDFARRNMEQQHKEHHPDEPFHRPRFPKLAQALKEAGYRTPKGNDHWRPAQVQQLLDGRFEQYYGK